MQKNVTIASFLILLIALGVWGQYELSPVNFRENLALSIYQILTLFVLEGDWTRVENLPWQLEVTRFLAPFATIAGVLLVFTKDAWIGITNFFLRYSRDQVVVAGLGDKAWQFIASCHSRYKVIVVEIDKDNLYIERTRLLGASVIIGDILEPSMFDKVNLIKARHLVAYTDNDGVNVEMAVKARNYLDKKSFSDNLSGNRQLRIHIHVNDTRISQRLETYPKFFDAQGPAELNFFSVYELNARILFDQHPPEVYADVLGKKQVHIALYFFGRLAEHILLEASRVCHFANQSRVKFTIFDEHAIQREHELKIEYPHLAELIDFSFVSLPIRQPSSIESIPEEILCHVTEHVICLPTDEESFTLALVLRSTILNMTNCNAPILVRMQQASGLAQLLESNLGEPEIPDGLYPFGMLDETLHYETVLSDKLDLLARVLHEDWLNQKSPTEEERKFYSALGAWTSLSEPEKKNSRLEADHLPLKLRAIRCVASEGNQTSVEISHEDATLLAAMEHDRWHANKSFEGWKAGPERIESAKVNPFAVGWNNLSETEKQIEIDAIRRLPQLLSKQMGWCMKKELVIGVTGHRLGKMDPDCLDLQANIESLLQEIINNNPDHKFVIVSALAEGADRLVAKIAMNMFSMSLQVPLPLPYELYQTDFTSEESVEEFKEMVGKAEFYFELPMKFGNLEQLASNPDGNINDSRDKQYALAGSYLVERCDELIAIYDDLPESGTGGTAQVVRWRKNKSIDDEFRNQSDFFQRPPLKDPLTLLP